MHYPELAALLSRLGCTDAINLDGGGSSTLWLDGHIMNSPSDGRERRVANSLVVVSKEQDRKETEPED
jgi:exopolysaccharide biosynthesis protein